ncbi:MAG TPA: hypothetical protein VJ724_14145 [Tahibacter sp.]|nr:hypothetical protein [Tahibacter sp.]
MNDRIRRAAAAVVLAAFASSSCAVGANGLPGACAAFADGARWRVLLESPLDAATLVALAESMLYARVPDDRRPPYDEYWVSDPEGHVGLCRVSRIAANTCGEATARFVRDAAGAWSVAGGEANTRCR